MRTGDVVVQVQVSAACNQGCAHQQTANKTPAASRCLSLRHLYDSLPDASFEQVSCRRSAEYALRMF